MKNTIFFFTLCLIALSCTKENKDGPVYINEQFKSHFDFKPGTYWIFYDSLTGHTDSFVVHDTLHRKPFEGPGHDKTKTEDIYKYITIYNITNDSIISAWDLIILAPDKLQLYVQGPTLQILSGEPITLGEFDRYSCRLLSSYVDAGNIYNNIYSFITYYSPSNKTTINISLDSGFVSILSTAGTLLQPTSLHLLRKHIIK